MKAVRFVTPLLMILALAAGALLTSGCSKTPEEMGDEFAKDAEMTKNPRAKEEREKKAYLKYLDAINFYNVSGKSVPKSLKEKLLRVTLKKLNREIARFTENPEEANLSQMELWREDFTTFLPGLNSPEITEGYSQFLLAFANPEWMDLSDMIKVLNEVVELKVQAPAAREKIAQVSSQFASDLLVEVEKMMAESKEALAQKKANAKENLVFAEYKTLVALKYDSGNQKAKALLSELRGLLLDTYSGYEKFEDNLDPEIDKYDIYLCVPKMSLQGKTANVQVAFWNLTSNPMTVRRESFYLVTDANDTVQADKKSRLDKILVDTKTDTSGLVIFNMGAAKGAPKNLLYSDGNKISEKFFK